MYTNDPTYGISDCWDHNGHGSHVAGIAAGRDNNVGYIGIANHPTLVTSIRVCNVSGQCPIADVLGGLDWAIGSGLPRHIVNMSLGFGATNYPALQTAASQAVNAGIILVAAAGNVGVPATAPSLNYPSDYIGVIKVSGVKATDTFADTIVCANTPPPISTYVRGSQYGANVALSAPFAAYSMWLNGTWGNLCGTSMATPHVTGVAALVWAKYQWMTATDVKARLFSTAIDLGPTGWDSKYGYGRVDANRAVNMLSAFINGPYDFWQGSKTLNFTASYYGGTGMYSFQWSWKNQTSGTWTSGGTSSSYSRSVGGSTPSWDLKLVVTSGSWTSTDQWLITNCTQTGC